MCPWVIYWLTEWTLAYMRAYPYLVTAHVMGW